MWTGDTVPVPVLRWESDLSALNTIFLIMGASGVGKYFLAPNLQIEQG